MGFSNRLSWRRFLLLVRGLPYDSAYHRWINNDKNRSFATWDDSKIDSQIRNIGKKGGR